MVRALSFELAFASQYELEFAKIVGYRPATPTICSFLTNWPVRPLNRGKSFALMAWIVDLLSNPLDPSFEVPSKSAVSTNPFTKLEIESNADKWFGLPDNRRCGWYWDLSFQTLSRDKKKGLAFPFVIMVLTGARVRTFTTWKVLFSLNSHFLSDLYSPIVND